jgi:hypothetical protein
MLAIDLKLSVSVNVPVKPFVKGSLTLGFTRGFTQSQGFFNHYGPKVQIQPPAKQRNSLIFDTAVVAGKAPDGNPYLHGPRQQFVGISGS